jgi:hypothetical protein
MKAILGFVLGMVIAGAISWLPGAWAQDNKTGEKVGTGNPQTTTKPKPPEFKSTKEKASYCIGLRLGQTILSDFGRSDVVDIDAYVKGLKAGLANEVPFDNSELRGIILGYRNEVIKDDAKKFLEANGKKEGVKTTSSGLQYVELKKGDGPKPKADSTVKVHYVGTLVNGSKFDSSIDRGEPAEFQLGGLIQAWKEAIPMMNVGSKWRLFVPPEIGYGERGSPPKIPPYAVLVFEIELLEVK